MTSLHGLCYFLLLSTLLTVGNKKGARKRGEDLLERTRMSKKSKIKSLNFIAASFMCGLVLSGLSYFINYHNINYYCPSINFTQIPHPLNGNYVQHESGFPVFFYTQKVSPECEAVSSAADELEDNNLANCPFQEPKCDSDGFGFDLFNFMINTLIWSTLVALGTYVYKKTKA
jgi:hypothetical protein